MKIPSVNGQRNPKFLEKKNKKVQQGYVTEGGCVVLRRFLFRESCNQHPGCSVPPIKKDSIPVLLMSDGNTGRFTIEETDLPLIEQLVIRVDKGKRYKDENVRLRPRVHLGTHRIDLPYFLLLDDIVRNAPANSKIDENGNIKVSIKRKRSKHVLQNDLVNCCRSFLGFVYIT